MYCHRLSSGNSKLRKTANIDPYQSILILNDDCLYEVLSYLSLQDLCRIGSTCRRINIVAKSLYKRFVNLDAKEFLTKNQQLTMGRKLDIIIKQIAHHVKSFQISDIIKEENGSRRCQYLIKSILLHCNNIISLQIGFGIEYGFMSEMCGFQNFQKLETINIKRDQRDQTRLEELARLKHFYEPYIISSNNELLMLKNLESFSADYIIAIKDDVFSQFCDNNPDIKRIRIGRYIPPTFVDLIVDKLKHLEDITLLHNKTDVGRLRNSERISEIKSLKRFTGKNVPELLKKLTDTDQLESLTYNDTAPEEANLITKLTKLKYLRVDCYNDIQLNSLKSQNILEHLVLDGSDVTNIGIVNFVSGANSLKYLSLCSCFYCDDDVLDMLSNFIKLSKKRLKLTIMCDFIHHSQCVNYPLLDINCNSYRVYQIK